MFFCAFFLSEGLLEGYEQVDRILCISLFIASALKGRIDYKLLEKAG